MFPRLLPTILSLVAALVLLFSALSGGARADEATLNQTFIQSQIKDLESSAKHDLEDAALAAARASEYGDKERAAQKTSDGATNATVKEVWSETASGYRKSRIHEEEEQKRLKDSAAQKQVEAQRLRGQLTRGRDAAGSPPPPPAPPPPSVPTEATQSSSKRHADLVDFIGLWRDRAYAGDVILEAEDPENPTHADRVKLTGKKNLHWEGHVALGETGRPTRFTFTVRPTWDQLNPEIPEWARKQVEGVVEWKLELEHDEAECVCVDATLHAKWYPGEVRWAGDGPAGKARVTGPGKPIEFELNKEDDDIGLAGYFSPTIVVHLGDPERARVEPIEYLIHGQEFQVQILMTREEAKKRGDVIEIKVQGKTSGSQTTVKLTLAAQTRNNFVVRYEQHGQLTFDDKGKEYPQGASAWLKNHLFSFTFEQFVEWWYGGGPGQPPPEYGTEGGRLPLKLKNGEEVEFTFEKAIQSVRVYDTQAKLILARYTDTFENLIQTLGTLLTNPKLNEAQRNNVQVRLRIVQNALAFATKVKPEQLQDLVRMEIVRIYYQDVIFDNRKQTLFGAGGTEAPPTNPYGIVWVSKQEQATIKSKIDIYRDIAKKDVFNMGLDTALGKLMPMVALATAVPSMIFHLTPFGDAYIVVKGRDVMGNKVDLSDRIGAACNLTLSALTFGINVAGLVREVSLVRRIHGLGAATEFRQLVVASSAGHATADIQRDAKLRALIELAEEHIDRRTTCAGPSAAVKVFNDPKAIYSAEIKTRPAPESLRAHINTGPNCRFEAIDDAVAKKTGVSMDPDTARKLRDTTKGADGKPLVPFLQEEGGNNSQVRGYANLRGARVSTVWATVPDIAQAHEAGLTVTAKLHLNGAVPALHQVTVWDVEYGPVGRLFNRPKYFWLHDSNFPDILIGVKASEFDRLLVKPEMLVRVASKEMLASGKTVFVYEQNERGQSVMRTKPASTGQSFGGTAGNADLVYFPQPPTPKPPAQQPHAR